MNQLLTGQEKKVLLHLSQGHLYKEIAAELNVSINTIKKHLKNAYRKLNVSNRNQAVKAFIVSEMDQHSIV